MFLFRYSAAFYIWYILGFSHIMNNYDISCVKSTPKMASYLSSINIVLINPGVIFILRSLKSRCMSLGQNLQATPFQLFKQRTGITVTMRVDWGAATLLLQRHPGSVVPSCIRSPLCQWVECNRWSLVLKA